MAFNLSTIDEILYDKRYNVFYHVCHGSIIPNMTVRVPKNTVIIQTGADITGCLMYGENDDNIMKLFTHNNIKSTLHAFNNRYANTLRVVREVGKSSKAMGLLGSFPTVHTMTVSEPESKHFSSGSDRNLSLLNTFECKFPGQYAIEKNISLYKNEEYDDDMGTFKLTTDGLYFDKDAHITKLLVHATAEHDSILQSEFVNYINTTLYPSHLNIHIFATCAVYAPAPAPAPSELNYMLGHINNTTGSGASAHNDYNTSVSASGASAAPYGGSGASAAPYSGYDVPAPAPYSGYGTSAHYLLPETTETAHITPSSAAGEWQNTNTNMAVSTTNSSAPASTPYGSWPWSGGRRNTRKRRASRRKSHKRRASRKRYSRKC